MVVVKIGYYAITNGNGSFIRHDESTNKYVPIRSAKYAKKFDSVQKAESVLKNSVSKTIRAGYSVQFFVTGNEINPDGVQQEQQQDNDASIYGFDGWLEKMAGIKEMTLLSSGNRITELKEEIKKADKEIVDISHYIEFGNFNCYQGWLCFRRLQNTLRKRRKYKDEVDILTRVKSLNIDAATIDSIISSFSSRTDRHYCPRILPELFTQE